MICVHILPPAVRDRILIAKESSTERGDNSVKCGISGKSGASGENGGSGKKGRIEKRGDYFPRMVIISIRSAKGSTQHRQFGAGGISMSVIS